jgi:hypothetical protein
VDVAPCPDAVGQVVKASKVHFPQPFLISDGSKRTAAKIRRFLMQIRNDENFRRLLIKPMDKS